jgi:hypothetical protein
MLRSTLAFAFSVVLVMACAKTSDNPPVVTAPVASAAAPSADSAPTIASAAPGASAPSEAGAPLTTAATDTADAGPSAAFQACQSDSDCVAVPRVGCCYNGWKEAVNSAQKDAYAASFTCPRRHPCPMYIIRDTRVPRCDTGTHLCQMVAAQP